MKKLNDDAKLIIGMFLVCVVLMILGRIFAGYTFELNKNFYDVQGACILVACISGVLGFVALIGCMLRND